MRLTRPSSLLRALCAPLLLITGYTAAQQPINADLITRGTLAPARIADGSLSTVKLGSDITAFARTLLQSIDAAAARNALVLGNVNNTSDANKPVSTAQAAADNAARDAAIAVAASDATAKADAAKARASHTGSQLANTISDFASASRAQAEGALIAGSNISITPAGTGATRTLTIASTASGGAGVTDGDKGDLAVTGTGSVWTIKSGVVNTTRLGGDITAFAKALLDDIDAAAMRATLGLGGAATLSVGTGAGTVAAGNDTRLSDTRVPTDASVTDAKVAAGAAIAESKLALASDAAAGVASRRTLGTGALQAAAGNDARLSDQRVPTDGSVTTTKLSSSLLSAFNAKLGAAETGGTTLAFGAVPDGSYLRRSGTSLVGDPAGAVSPFKLPSRTGSEADRPSASGNAGRAIRLVNLGTGSGYARSIWQESDGSTWGNVNGVASLFHTYTPGAAVSLVVTDTQYSVCPTVTVPGGLMGPNTLLRVMPHVRASASQANNALRVFFGGQVLYLSSGGWHDVGPSIRVANAGVTNAQTRFGPGNGSTGFGLNAVSTYKPQLAIDTSVNQDITITAAGTAGDTMTCMGLNVELVDP